VERGLASLCDDRIVSSALFLATTTLLVCASLFKCAVGGTQPLAVRLPGHFTIQLAGSRQRNFTSHIP